MKHDNFNPQITQSLHLKRFRLSTICANTLSTSGIIAGAIAAAGAYIFLHKSLHDKQAAYVSFLNSIPISHVVLDYRICILKGVSYGSWMKQVNSITAVKQRSVTWVILGDLNDMPSSATDIQKLPAWKFFLLHIIGNGECSNAVIYRQEWR